MRRQRPGDGGPDASIGTAGRKLGLHVCLGTMVDSWRNTSYSFRFFSPEQVDQILRDGFGRGREGSHAAITRILKHEPGLQRAQLWQRIRRLKSPASKPHHFRSVWTSEDEKILRAGYQNGWQDKRKAISQLLNRHPDWRPHVIWKHAARLGLVQGIQRRGQERSRQVWSEDDDRILLDLAGYRSAMVIAKLLRRSESAVRTRLALLDKSSRVHLEGFARSALARELHLSTDAIQRFIVDGLMEVRDPRVTRESLDRLCRSGLLPAMGESAKQVAPQVMQGSDGETTGVSIIGKSVTRGKPSRAKQTWAEVARSLNVAAETIEDLIARGVLELYDPRITEQSLRNFCRRHGSLINSDFLSRETCDWLKRTMDFVPHAGEPFALCLTPLRKHARVVRRCAKCGRAIRGNAFFRHDKRCKGVDSLPQKVARLVAVDGGSKPPKRSFFPCSQSANNLLSS